MLVGKLLGFGLRQVVGDVAGNATETVANLVVNRFRDNSLALSNALARANDRSWQALAIALAGDGLLDKITVFFASGEDKGIREQVRIFLEANQVAFHNSSAQFRTRCLADLKKAKAAGLLKADASLKNVAAETALFQRYADRKGLIDAADQVVRQISDDFGPGYPNLAKLLRETNPPLLVSCFAYFLRREVETNQELAHGLMFDGLRQLSASQEVAFGNIGRALDSIGDKFEELFEQLDRIETKVGETHGAVLDLQVELARVGQMHLANTEEARRLLGEVLSRVSQLGMQKGEVKPHHSFSIRSEDERIAVKKLLARFREMPAEQQKRLPALLNGLGKLQIGSGDYEGARQSFVAVAENVKDVSAEAEAHFNAYRAALEQKKWDVALSEIQKAAALDSGRFSPFPMNRYHPKRILGAGGFGTAFLCNESKFDEEVVVKSIHAGDLDRNTTDVFREALLLRKLSHPSIIGVRDYEYADPIAQIRPFIVMDYCPGGSLEHFVQEQGAVSPDTMIAIACKVADGLNAAHLQGILHRDIKPDNILIWRSGDNWDVKIIDFGLALRNKTIETSIAAKAAGHTVLNKSVEGTIKYAPPEQLGELNGTKPGPYSDVYSFGKMCCYAMFNTTEPKDRHWKVVPESIRCVLKEMLDQCREEDLVHRFRCFDPVLAALRTLNQTIRMQQDGEHALTELLHEIFSRTHGKPTKDDTTAATNLSKQHRIPIVRAKQIASDFQEQWRRTHQPAIEKLNHTMSSPESGSRRTSDSDKVAEQFAFSQHQKVIAERPSDRAFRGFWRRLKDGVLGAIFIGPLTGIVISSGIRAVPWVFGLNGGDWIAWVVWGGVQGLRIKHSLN